MYRRIFHRGLALLGTSAVIAALGIAVAAPAQADPICVGATVSGTATGTHEVGPYCQPYPWSTLCAKTGVGLDPTVVVRTFVCVPI